MSSEYSMLQKPWQCMGVGKEGAGGGLKPHQILSSCYHVYNQLPQKDIQNLLLQKNKREKKTAFRIQAVLYLQK